jgi:hypothetical protein
MEEKEGRKLVAGKERESSELEEKGQGDEKGEGVKDGEKERGRRLGKILKKCPFPFGKVQKRKEKKRKEKKQGTEAFDWSNLVVLHM